MYLSPNRIEPLAEFIALPVGRAVSLIASVFTDKRIIVINVQGITGKKKDFTSLPYSKIQSFSVETAGVLDLDSELVLWFSGLGKVKLEFTSDCNVSEICRMISEKVL
ncbi:PH domain-containing protein [Oscillospiraceae bacterium LTW-04]|nr:PH domain-containing protein [Oscillospiraceae bacterium MB24-C1]